MSMDKHRQLQFHRRIKIMRPPLLVALWRDCKAAIRREWRRFLDEVRNHAWEEPEG